MVDIESIGRSNHHRFVPVLLFSTHPTLQHLFERGKVDQMSRIQEQLVILQPTPFCNIDCKYCYLPNRSNTKRMSPDVLASIYQNVFRSLHVSDPFEFVWHAGEPLTVPYDYYEHAFDLANQLNIPFQRKYRHAFQTNAILLDDQWIELIKRHKVRVGVSLDGPAFIHDAQRITRSKQGTHAKVMEGVSKLQEAEIEFNVIMVLTSQALDYADEIFQFFTDEKIEYVAFNIDELEGSHDSSSYQALNSIDRYKVFMRRFLYLVDRSRNTIKVREFRQLLPTLLSVSPQSPNIINSTNTPFDLLTFDYLGNYSTFCPELSGTLTETYANFVMGNILENPLDDMMTNFVFQKVNAEVQAGVKACRETCVYWNFCGGGSPSNKFFEHGRFDVTETLVCRVHKQALVDVMVDYLTETLTPSI